MYLIDTSVWIDYFREIDNASTSKFIHILDHNLPFGLTEIIYQEILQGASSDSDFNKLKDYLMTQRFFFPKEGLISYESAAKLFFRCRRKGVTIRNTIDYFIAQVAIEHELILLHNDQDYVRIQSVIPELLLL